MYSTIRKVIATAIIAAAVYAPAAQAACTLPQLGGKWKAYSSGTQNGVTFWRSCLINIASNGNFSPLSCVDSIGTNAIPTNGRFALQNSANCAYSATFTFRGQLNQVLNMTLARDKYTAYGVGRFPGGQFIFSMVKI